MSSDYRVLYYIVINYDGQSDFVRFSLCALKTIKRLVTTIVYSLSINFKFIVQHFGFISNELYIFVQIKEDCKPLLLSNEQLFKLMEDMDKAIKSGLGKATNPSSVVKCYVTYVQDLPNGKGKLKKKPLSVITINRYFMSFF